MDAVPFLGQETQFVLPDNLHHSQEEPEVSMFWLRA